MTTIDTTTTTVEPPSDDLVIDYAQLAAVAFLARYSGRTLDAYRHDLRGFFQWAADMQLSVLAATRPHIELFRSCMEERAWRHRRSTGGCRRCAASTASPTSTGASPRTQPVRPPTPSAPVQRPRSRPL
jgi:hypothetical protein